MLDPLGRLSQDLKNGVQGNLTRLVARQVSSAGRRLGNQLAWTAMLLTIVPLAMVRVAKMLGADISYG